MSVVPTSCRSAPGGLFRCRLEGGERGVEPTLHVHAVVGVADRGVELGQEVALLGDPARPLPRSSDARDRHRRRTPPTGGEPTPPRRVVAPLTRWHHPSTRRLPVKPTSTDLSRCGLFDDAEHNTTMSVRLRSDLALTFGYERPWLCARRSAHIRGAAAHREVVAEMFLGEVVGTCVLILLGDGVVAGVLLNKSKAQNSGWIVITWAWAMGVLPRRGRQPRGDRRRRAAQPGRDPRSRVDRARWTWGDVPTLIAGQFVGRVPRRDPRVARVLRALGRDRGPRPEARRVLHRPGDPQHGGQPHHGDHRHRVAGVRRRGHRDQARRRVPDPRLRYGRLDDDRRHPRTGACRSALLVLGIGMSLGGPTGYAINPARDLGPRIIHASCRSPARADSDWAYSWIPVVGPLDRRRASARSSPRPRSI